MEHMFTRIYALLVCFVTIICITISTGMALYELVKVVNPELTLIPYQYQHLQSNERYGRMQYPASRIHAINGAQITMLANGRMKAPGDAAPRLSDEEITRIREREFQTLISNERKQATASLIRLFIVLLVSCPLFYIHWRLAQRYESV